MYNMMQAQDNMEQAEEMAMPEMMQEAP